MSTRSGKRIHSSPQDENNGEFKTSCNAIKTRSKRLTKDSADQQLTEKKRKKHYVKYPSDEVIDYNESNVTSTQSLRKSRRNTLKERNVNNTSTEESELRQSLKTTRRTRRCEDPVDIITQAAGNAGEKKNRSKKKKLALLVNENQLLGENTESIAPSKKKSNKKKSKKKSSSIIVEEVNPKNLNASGASVDSFHSAAGSPTPKQEDCSKQHNMSDKKSDPKQKKYSSDLKLSHSVNNSSTKNKSINNSLNKSVLREEQNDNLLSNDLPEAQISRKRKSSSSVSNNTLEDNESAESCTTKRSKHVSKKKIKLSKTSFGENDLISTSCQEELASKRKITKNAHKLGEIAYTTIAKNNEGNCSNNKTAKVSITLSDKRRNTVYDKEDTDVNTFVMKEKVNGRFKKTSGKFDRESNKNNTTFTDEDRTNMTFNIESEANTSLDKEDKLNGTFDKKDKMNTTFEEENNVNSTFNKNDKSNTTFNKEDISDMISDKETNANTTFDRINESNRTFCKEDKTNISYDKKEETKSTFNKGDKANRTLEKVHKAQTTFDIKDEASSTIDDNDSKSTFDNKDKANSTFDKEDKGNSTFNKEDKANSTFNKEDEAKSTFDKNNKANSTFDKEDKGNSTFNKEDKANSTFNKDDEAKSTFDKNNKANSTFDKEDKGNSTFNKDDKANSTFNKDDEAKSTFDKNNKANSTFDKEDKGNSTFNKDDKANSTFDKKNKANSTFDKEDKSNSTFDNKHKANSTFDKEDKGNSTFNKDENANSTFDKKNKANSTFDKKHKANSTFDKEDKAQSTFIEEDTSNSTFVNMDNAISKSGKTSALTKKANKNGKLLKLDLEKSQQCVESAVKKRSSIRVDKSKIHKNTSLGNISNDHSNDSIFTSDSSQTSHISVTSDESHSENILNNTPLLVESSLEEEYISKSNSSPAAASTVNTTALPTPLKREGTFTKESPEIKVASKNKKSIDKTPTRRKSLPSPGCTPFPLAKSLSKDKSILNITRSIEKSRRSSVAETVPRATKVMFCSPSNNPAVVSQMKGKIIKSSLKGSNKSFIFEDNGCSSQPRLAGRKRSQTADRPAGAEPQPKRSRLAEPLAASAPSPRPARLRSRTLSASGKLPESVPATGRAPPADSPARERPRTRLPNFAALHARQFARMESLDECQRRRAERARLLLTPTGPVAVERVSPKDNQPKQSEASLTTAKKTDTPTKVKPTPLTAGYSRFGFKLQADGGGHPFSFTASKAAAARADARAAAGAEARAAAGLKRQATMPSLAGTTRKQLARQAVMREKSFTGKRDDNRQESRTVIRGVRTNRRFELQMKMRNINA